MFDSLLIKQGGYSLTEWAEQGWLPGIYELLPFEIAFLAFPFVWEDDNRLYENENLKKDFLTFCQAIMDAVEYGHLQAETISLWDYKPPYEFPGAGTPEFEAYSEFLDYGDFKNWASAFLWIKARRKIPGECAFKKIPIPVIRRAEFEKWLASIDATHTDDESNLAKWLATGDAETTCTHDKAPLQAANTTDTQSAREKVLLEWLETKEKTTSGFDKWLIEDKQSDIWAELGKYNPKLFRTAAGETIKKFFAKQKLCDLKKGRK